MKRNISSQWAGIIAVALIICSVSVAVGQDPGRMAPGGSIVSALVAGADLVAEGMVVSVGPARETPRLQNAPNAPRIVSRETDVALRLTEVFKGSLRNGSEVMIVRDVPDNLPGRALPNIETGQRVLMFLVRAKDSSPEIQRAPVLKNGPPRYEVFYVAGFDTASAGLLEIVDGNIRRVRPDLPGEWNRYIGALRETIVAEIDAYLAKQGSLNSLVGLVKNSDGDPVRGAAVRVIDQSTGTEFAALTNTDGAYRVTVRQYKFGKRYRMVVEAGGFLKTEIDNVGLDGDETRVDVRLK